MPPSGTFLGSAYLRETKTCHSPPVESIRHAGNFFISRYQCGPFLFFVAEVMSNYLTTDGLKTFSLLPEAPPRGLRPVAFATSATWLIRHWVGSRHGLAPAVSRTTPDLNARRFLRTRAEQHLPFSPLVRVAAAAVRSG